MTRRSWVDRVNQTNRAEPPPRTGKGATTKAWKKHAEDLGYELPADAGRDTIIAIVDAGPPPLKGLDRNPKIEGPVFEATRAAIETAAHLTPMDQPTVAVLLELAKSIDGMEHRPSTAPLDNWTVPTFLRYAESLGLTPTARHRLDLKQPRPRSALAEARKRWGSNVVG